MSQIKLTKTELRTQQTRFTQLQRYLPTLQLKKAMLQAEVSATLLEIGLLQGEWRNWLGLLQPSAALFTETIGCNILASTEILHVVKHYENVAGVEIPRFEQVVFRESEYFCFDTPIWTDQGIAMARNLVIARERLNVAVEKKRALEKELKEVSIRVNLFEKILIPRSILNINKIRIFLGDQQLAAVAQAKVAKKKVLAKRI